MEPRIRMWLNLAAEFARRKHADLQRLAGPSLAPCVDPGQVAALPELMQRYLHRCGAIGRPPIRACHTRYDAVMFQKPGGRPLPGRAEQVDIVQTARRLFFMASRLWGLPVAVLHDYRDSQASMRVRIASLVDVTNLASQTLARTETVTLFNDLCFFAPSALSSSAFVWETLDDTQVEGSFTNGEHVVKATLVFDAEADLVNFVSDDRCALQPDGSLQQQRWSTPMRAHRSFGGRRIPTAGEAIWHTPQGEFVYGRLEVTSYRTW